MKRIAGVVLIVIVIVVLMLVLFIPFVEVEVSKHEVWSEVVDSGWSNWYDDYYTTCEPMLRSGITGGYFVEAEVAGETRNTTRYIHKDTVLGISLTIYGVQADRCSWHINGPNVKETKSVFQVLTGG